MPCLSAKSRLPQWVEDAIPTGTAHTDPGTEALLLHTSVHVDYSDGKTLSRTIRQCIEVRTWDQQGRAVMNIPYNKGSDRIRALQAWLISSDGKSKSYREKDTKDRADDLESLYSESRVRMLDLSTSIRPGSVFAYEYTVTGRGEIADMVFDIQQDIPVLHCSLRITVPKDWECEFVLHNGQLEASSRNENTFLWEAHNIEPVPIEKNSPPLSERAMFLVVRMLPETPVSDSNKLRIFRNWQDIARYGDAHNSPMAEVDEKIATKASQLASHLNSPWEKIQAITTFTQSLNYLAINRDLNWGGGYRPFPAGTVLDRGYGDCKDMTALTRALLKAQGIDSYAVYANAGQIRSRVVPDWPALCQFDHCIVAIPLPDGIEKPAIVRNPELGRLLIFDPTLKHTPIGELPSHLAGSHVLLLYPGATGLIRLPDNLPNTHSRTRNLSYRIDEDGSVTGELFDRSSGNLAVRDRATFRKHNDSGYKDLWRDRLRGIARDARVDTASVQDDFPDNAFSQTISFSATQYGRSIRNRLLAFRPVLLSEKDWLPPTGEPRKTPYIIAQERLHEHYTIQLPLGFVVDELPPPVNLGSAYGSYSLKVLHEGEALAAEREIIWHAMDVPPEDYLEFVRYCQSIAAAEQTPAVLTRP